jgi:hypothetical protein
MDHAPKDPSGLARKGREMRLLPILTSIALIALVPRPASAGRIEALERAAKKACLTGDATKGVSLLADLFIDTNDATYIFNQGRCFQQNNRFEEAIAKFREYIRKTGGSGAVDKLAEKHIAECQALMGKKEPEAAKPVEEVAKPVEPVQEVKPVLPAPEVSKPTEPVTSTTEPTKPQDGQKVPEPEATAIESAKPVDSSGGSGLRTAGIVVVATGVAGLAAGVGFNLKHNGMVSDLQKAYDPDKDSSAKTYQTLSQVGYGVGAACLVGGAVLYYLGWRAGRVVVATVPVAGVGGGLVVGGTL